jgi:ribosomal protein S18 acetylase RimI-like enzyme
MEYRRATAEDIDVLVKLRIDMRTEREEKQCPMSLVDFGELTRNYFMRHIPDDSFIAWVAVEDGEIIATSGMCIYYVPPTYGNPSGKVAYLVNLYTKPEYRGRSIGTRLIELLVEDAGKRGCARITANASKMGRPILEKYGFTDVVGEMEYFIE